MKKIVYMTAFATAMVVGANAALISNGDWESDTAKWKSQDGGTPTAWTSSLGATSFDGAYVEPITVPITYGSGNIAGMKAVANNYFQQTLVGVDAGIGSITVNYDGGIRTHSSYAATPRNIHLRVSLWDTTTNTELAGITTITAYSTTAIPLSAQSDVLTYDATGLAGNTLAVRFANTTADDGALGGGNFNHSSVLLDNIDVIPEPATLGLFALFGGGIFFVRRKLAM